jgi:hypothetical protein
VWSIIEQGDKDRTKEGQDKRRTGQKKDRTKEEQDKRRTIYGR